MTRSTLTVDLRTAVEALRRSRVADSAARTRAMATLEWMLEHSAAIAQIIGGQMPLEQPEEYEIMDCPTCHGSSTARCETCFASGTIYQRVKHG